MTTDLKAEIVRIAHWKQLEAERDPDAANRWHLPKVAASAGQIASLRKLMGFDPPKDYCDFLALANGWKCFFIETDLFGTEDFQKGRHKTALERVELREFIARLGYRNEEVAVVGVSEFDLDVFLLVSPRAARFPGGLIWFASEEVDRFASFSDFISSMVNLTAELAKDAKP